MSKDADTKTKATTEKKTFSGVVVPSEGLIIGTKKPTKYAKGSTFTTDNESLYQNLMNQRKIK